MCSQFEKKQTKPATLRYSLICMSVQECVLEMLLKLFCQGPVGADTQGSFFWSWLLRRVWPDPEVSLCKEPASPLGWGMAWVRLDPLNFFLACWGDVEIGLRWVSSKHFAFLWGKCWWLASCWEGHFGSSVPVLARAPQRVLVASTGRAKAQH